MEARRAAECGLDAEGIRKMWFLPVPRVFWERTRDSDIIIPDLLFPATGQGSEGHWVMGRVTRFC